MRARLTGWRSGRNKIVQKIIGNERTEQTNNVLLGDNKSDFKRILRSDLLVWRLVNRVDGDRSLYVGFKRDFEI